MIARFYQSESLGRFQTEELLMLFKAKDFKRFGSSLECFETRLGENPGVLIAG